MKSSIILRDGGSRIITILILFLLISPGFTWAQGNSSYNDNTIPINGTNSVAFGMGALYLNTGYSNAAFGFRALISNTTGSGNTANGCYALSFNTTGNQNTANGADALYNNTTGNYNTANGYQALYYSTTANHNSCNGYRAL
jgi:hypothetical protein